MKKSISAITAAALAASMAFVAPAPVSAQSMTFSFGQGDRVIGSYCQRHPRDRDCRDWRDNRRSWRKSHYDRFYRSHRGDLDNLASGIFGFTFGAIIGSALANQDRRVYVDDRYVTSGHVARCQARFRSYDVRTDTYLGYDGKRHYCNL